MKLPVKKLGLNFCLNHKAVLYYCKSPIFKKDSEVMPGFLQALSEPDYVGMQPRFSDDYSRLAWFASTERFLTHSGNYQLKFREWPDLMKPVRTAIDLFKGYPGEEDTFAGIFGYNMTFTQNTFLTGSSRYFLLTTEFKGQDRIYIVDLESESDKVEDRLRWLDICETGNQERKGTYGLLGFNGKVAVVGFSSITGK